MATTKPQTFDLKACPFCGKKAEKPVEQFTCPGQFSFVHRCSLLGAIRLEGPLATIAKAWNTRKG